MLVVLILCVCFLSQAQLDNVASTNVVQETSSQIPHTDVHVQEDKVENAEISKSQGRKAQEVRILQLNTRENEQSTPDCPNTDILLKIFNLLTKSLPGGVVDPLKVKDVLSNIKGILEKATLSDSNDNLYNDYKSLQNELDKINNKDDNKLRAKITFQYDLPSNHKHQYQDVFYALVNYINNVYDQYARYCLITGRCNVNDLPKISLGATAQLAGQHKSSSNQYSIHNPNAQVPQGNVDSNGKGVKDITNLHQNYKLNPLTYLYNPSNQYNLHNAMRGISNYQVSNGALNTPEFNFIASNFNHLQTDKNPKTFSSKNIPLQDIYSALQGTSWYKPNQDFAKVLPGKYYDIKAQNINKGTDTNKDILNVFKNSEPKMDLQQSVGQNLSLYLDTIGVPKVENQNPLLKSQNSKLFNSHMQESNSDSDLYKYMLSYLNNNNVLNPSNVAQNPILTNPQYGGYVTPDINNLRVQLPDLSQLGVSNPTKLNANHGLVELTYTLKRPKPAYEPLYYVKYRIPYPTFLYNLQNLLIQKPYLRNDPKNLYQELLLKANVSEASGDLKNLKHEEIVNLVSQNGTLVTAKILQINDTFIDDVKTIQDLNSNMAANLNSSDNVGGVGVIKSASFDNFTNVAIANLKNKMAYPYLKYTNPAPLNAPTYLQTYVNKYSNMG